jgi:hypothetical protein
MLLYKVYFLLGTAIVIARSERQKNRQLREYQHYSPHNAQNQY